MRRFLYTSGSRASTRIMPNRSSVIQYLAYSSTSSRTGTATSTSPGGGGGASRTLKVDRSGLIQFGEKWPSQEEIEKVAKFKEPLSPLGKVLRDTIKVRGPLSVHDYMSQALHHEKYGYYQQKKEKIGTGGDFITSPEISQLFGEMVGIWCLATWEKMGCPAEINLVELGPGNGTLMKDTLNIVKNFPEFHKALRVSMVEISPAMRDLQRIALECTDVTSSTNEGSGSVSSKGEMDESLANDWAEQTEAECMSATTKGGIPIAWYNYLKHVPAGPSLYVGHEILDAFPVHQFSKTAEQGRWRETMVDVDFDEKSPFHFRFVKTPTITPALRIFFNKTFTGVSHQPLSTQHSAEGSGDLSGELSPEKSGQSSDHALSTKNLEGLEISPLAFSTVEEIAQNVVKHKGAALLIDYGEPYPQEDTLRGFQQHAGKHVLSEPGCVDITADVNFAACAQIAKEQGADVQGAITQGQFLFNMGLVTRVEQVLDAESTTDEQAQDLVQSTEKILTGEMGTKFKAIAISHAGLITPGFEVASY